jgi:hypothetical protein
MSVARVTAPSRFDRPIRRENAVNWGDRTRLDGRKQQTLAWVSLTEAQPLMIYATANVRRGPAVCVVSVEWGHGGASITADYPVVKRLRVPVAASMVKLSARLVEASGAPVAAGVTADVSAFIATGIDGQTLRNTEWRHQKGSAGVIAKGPQRVMTIDGFNAGGATFLHLFDDDAYATGDEPAILIPAAAGRRFRARRFDSQAFRTGVYWAASSTPLVFTPDASADLRVDVELLQ